MKTLKCIKTCWINDIGFSVGKLVNITEEIGETVIIEEPISGMLFRIHQALNYSDPHYPNGNSLYTYFKEVKSKRQK